MTDQDKDATQKDLRESNLDWFAAQFPAFHRELQDYQPVSKVVDEGEGWHNVSFSGELLYQPSAKEHVKIQRDAFIKSPYRLNMYPPQPENFDRYASNVVHKIIERIHGEKIEISAFTPGTKSYYLTVFGFGLGAHIEELVEKTECQCLMIVEPNMEFIFQSLEIFDWKNLHDIIDARGGFLDLIISNSQDTIFEKIKGNIRGTNPCSFDSAIFFTHYSNDMFAALWEQIQKDVNIILSGLGFYFDETVMITNTHENLHADDVEMIRFSRDTLRSYPAIIVASGPSLDKDIEWIKKHQDQVIIFACGSAIMPLLRNDIQPDFQVEIENIPELYDMFVDTVKYTDVSKVHLLATTTIDARVPKFFDRTSYFFRPALASYPIFARTEDEPLHNGSPTVTNAALSLAQNFGFREIYLFGVDMGVKVEGQVHSKHAWQNTDEGCELDIKHNLPIRGNFGGTVYTYSDMNWTRSELILGLKNFKKGRLYYNCSDGAYIQGTMAKNARAIKVCEQPIKKSLAVQHIVDEFRPYAKEDFEQKWTDEKMRDAFAAYSGRLLDCLEKPEDVASKRALTELNKILVAYNQDGLELGLSMTFRGSIWQALLGAEYYINRVDGEKQRAKADQIFKEELDRLIRYLRDIAIEDLGHLTEREWVPRARTLEFELEDWGQ